MLITNARIFGEDDRFRPGTIQTYGERIAEVKSNNDDSSVAGDEKMIDGQGMYAIPGIIDIHLHGCQNYDFCTASKDQMEAMASYLLGEGVTAFMPAIMAQPVNVLFQMMERIRAFEQERTAKGADLIGINLEAPFISYAKRGAQNGNYLQAPDTQLFRSFQEAAGGLIKVVGVAPELNGAMEFIRDVHGEVVVSLAHTEADYATGQRAFALGAGQLTHIFNAMTPMHHRSPGVIGAAFEQTNVMVEMIGDGNFVHPCMMKMMFQIFSDERMILISDGMPPTGLPDGAYSLGGDAIYTRNGVGYMAADDTMAGPTISLARCLKAAVQKAGIPLESVIKSMTKNPAQRVGVFDQMGSISPGKYANIVLVDEAMNVQKIIYKGKVIK